MFNCSTRILGCISSLIQCCQEKNDNTKYNEQSQCELVDREAAYGISFFLELSDMSDGRTKGFRNQLEAASARERVSQKVCVGIVQ